MYKRIITQQIKDQLFQGKIIVLYGARQVGKTTLVKDVAQHCGKPFRYLNADEIDVRQGLDYESSDSLRRFIGSYPLVIIDEAQRIPNIGLKLKLLYDNFPEQQIIATGSSSFELANRINEPLTGRVMSYMLYPLSIGELKSPYEYLLSPDLLHHFLRFGSYPDIVTHDENRSKQYLQELINNYLYKDILSFDFIKKSSHIQKLLQLLAYQLGQEVSLTELANKLNLHVATVDRYIGLLEQMFVIVRISAWSTNQRNEIGKKEKIYFWDCGLRNAVISAFDPVDIRPDIGALWENFCITEKIKHNYYQHISAQTYFWRTYQQQEVDHIQIVGQQMDAYEYKWNAHKIPKKPSQFAISYPQSSYLVVNPTNYDKLFMIGI